MEPTRCVSMGPAGVSNAMCIKGLGKRRVGTMIAIQSNAALTIMLLTNPYCTSSKRCMMQSPEKAVTKAHAPPHEAATESSCDSSPAVCLKQCLCDMTPISAPAMYKVVPHTLAPDDIDFYKGKHL